MKQRYSVDVGDPNGCATTYCDVDINEAMQRFAVAFGDLKEGGSVRVRRVTDLPDHEVELRRRLGMTT